MPRLHEIPRGSKIKVYTDKGEQMITLKHPDGMYSLSVVDEDYPDAGKSVHLSVMTPLEDVGDYYIIKPEKNEENS